MGQEVKPRWLHDNMTIAAKTLADTHCYDFEAECLELGAKRIAELEAQLAAATERAAWAESSLRLATGCLAEGDLPEGWKQAEMWEPDYVLEDGKGARLAYVRLEKWNNGTMTWAHRISYAHARKFKDSDWQGRYNTAAEAIEAAQRAMKGE